MLAEEDGEVVNLDDDGEVAIEVVGVATGNASKEEDSAVKLKRWQDLEIGILGCSEEEEEDEENCDVFDGYSKGNFGDFAIVIFFGDQI